MCRPSGGKSLSLLDYWILKFNSMERAKGSKWPTAVGPEPDTSSEKEKNARMSPERTKRTKKSWVEVVWDLGYGKQGCCAPAWGYFEAYQLFLSPRWRITIRGGRKLYFLESNEKEVERSKQTCLWFQTYLKHFNSGSQDSRDLCWMNQNVPGIFLKFSINIH